MRKNRQKILQFSSGLLTVTAAFILVGFVDNASSTGPPPVISFQGWLTDETGDPKPDGAYALTFHLYSEPAGVYGENSVWGPDTHPGVVVQNGHFSVLLGDSANLAFPEEFFDTYEYLYLGVCVGVGCTVEMIPRQKLVSVPFSMAAASVGGFRPGHQEGQIPISDGQANATLNADMLDGYDAGHGDGQIPISDGQVNTDLNAELLNGYHAGHGSGEIPVSDGQVNAELNADTVDGYHASDLGCAFGQWESRDADTIYRASSDGFVVAVGLSEAGDRPIRFAGFSDGTDNPSTLRASVNLNQIGIGASTYHSLMFPVRKGDYWKVERYDAETLTVDWISLDAQRF